MTGEHILTIVFWSSFAWLAYVYVGYPLVIHVLARAFGRDTRVTAHEPTVTVIIAAYNEAAVIAATVENKLSQRYPVEKFEICVVSDDSTDGTDEIVQAIVDRSAGKIRLLRQSPRAGKTAALNLAVAGSKSEIIVFSDANSIYAPDTISRLVARFSDPSTGYVTGKQVYLSPEGSQIGGGSSAFMSYENCVRAAESKLAGCIGVNGGVDAVRRDLYDPMRADQQPDFVLPLNVASKRFRVVYEPQALLMEHALKNPKSEYRMRVRVTLRALWALADMRRLLNPFRHGLLSFQILSHKVLRYTAFVPILGMAIASGLLAGHSSFFMLAVVLQLICYALALIGLLTHGRALRPVTRFPSYFLLLNLASAHAMLRFVARQKQVVWSPRTG